MLTNGSGLVSISVSDYARTSARSITLGELSLVERETMAGQIGESGEASWRPSGSDPGPQRASQHESCAQSGKCMVTATSGETRFAKAERRWSRTEC